MPNIEAEKNQPRNNERESSNLFQDAYNFTDHIRPDVEGRLRQLNLIGYGAVAGGIKDIPNEFVHHPWETIGKLSVVGATGVGLSAALAAESPLIVGGATAASIALTAASLWHTSVKFLGDQKLMHSLDAVYKSGDKHTRDTSQKVAADVIGPEAFDYGIGIAGGFAGMYAPKLSEKLPLNFVTDRLKPFIPFAITPSGDQVHMVFADGSEIHMHGKQAIYYTDGKEYQLKVNENGIDMCALGSLAGRQVLKGARNDSAPGVDNTIKVDINPTKGKTELFTVIPASSVRSEYDKKNRSDWLFSSCEECHHELEAIEKAETIYWDLKRKSH